MYHASSERSSHQRRVFVDAERVLQSIDMRAHGVDRYPQDVCNFLGALAIAHQCQHFSLTRGQMVFHKIDMVTLSRGSPSGQSFFAKQQAVRTFP